MAKPDPSLELLLSPRRDLPNDWQKRFGVESRLELARRARRVTQSSLADAVGISERALRRLEHKSSGDNVSVQVLARAARVLEVPLLSLVDDDYLIEPARPGVPAALPSWRELDRTRGSRGYSLP